MSENSKDLETKLRKWLHEQGYPLEMLTAIMLQQHNFSVTLADYYTDFETEEAREIDVTAVRWPDGEQAVTLQVCCRVECKVAHKYPWVVFGSQDQSNERAPHRTLLCSDIFQTFLLESRQDTDCNRELQQASLLYPKQIGYGMTQAFTQGHDVPYRALMSAVKASIDRVTSIDDAIRNHPYLAICGVVIPTIVVDGRLFEYTIALDGDMDLQEVPISCIEWKGTNPTATTPLVYIVTKHALESFVHELDATATCLITLASQHKEKLTDIAERKQKVIVS